MKCLYCTGPILSRQTAVVSRDGLFHRDCSDKLYLEVFEIRRVLRDKTNKPLTSDDVLDIYEEIKNGMSL